jgi:hypothetical protein
MSTTPPPEQRAYAAWKLLQNGLPDSAEDELAALHGMINYRIRHHGRLLCKLTLPIAMTPEEWKAVFVQAQMILKHQVAEATPAAPVGES